MPDLHPTKTRLTLLAQVANDQVTTDLTLDEGDRVVLHPDAPTSWSEQVTVTARIRQLEAAGWIEEDPAAFWRLTDAGRDVLALEGHRAAV